MAVFKNEIAEIYSQHNDRVIPYMHYLTNSTTNTNNYCVVDPTVWQDYVLEWTPTHLKVTVGNTVCLDHKIAPSIGAAPQPFDHPFMVALMQGLGMAGNRIDTAMAPPFPATLEVDHLRVWQ